MFGGIRRLRDSVIGAAVQLDAMVFFAWRIGS
jgi:hypothetical protein